MERSKPDITAGNRTVEGTATRTLHLKVKGNEGHSVTVAATVSGRSRAPDTVSSGKVHKREVAAVTSDKPHLLLGGSM